MLLEAQPRSYFTVKSNVMWDVKGGENDVGITNIISKKNTLLEKKTIKNKQYIFNAKTFIKKIFTRLN